MKWIILIGLLLLAGCTSSFDDCMDTCKSLKNDQVAECHEGSMGIGEALKDFNTCSSKKREICYNECALGETIPVVEEEPTERKKDYMPEYKDLVIKDDYVETSPDRLKWWSDELRFSIEQDRLDYDSYFYEYGFLVVIGDFWTPNHNIDISVWSDWDRAEEVKWILGREMHYKMYDFMTWEEDYDVYRFEKLGKGELEVEIIKSSAKKPYIHDLKFYIYGSEDDLLDLNDTLLMNFTIPGQPDPNKVEKKPVEELLVTVLANLTADHVYDLYDPLGIWYELFKTPEHSYQYRKGWRVLNGTWEDLKNVTLWKWEGNISSYTTVNITKESYLRHESTIMCNQWCDGAGNCWKHNESDCKAYFDLVPTRQAVILKGYKVTE